VWGGDIGVVISSFSFSVRRSFGGYLVLYVDTGSAGSGVEQSSLVFTRGCMSSSYAIA